MPRKAAQPKKVKLESNAAADTVEDVSDSESKNTTEDFKPAKRGRKAAARNDSNPTETKESSSTNDVKSKNSKKKDGGPMTKYLKVASKNSEETSSLIEKDDEEEEVEEVPKRSNKGAKQKRGVVQGKKVKNESNAAAETVEDVSDSESKNTIGDSKPAKRGRKAAARNDSNKQIASTNSEETSSLIDKDDDDEEEEEAKEVPKRSNKGAKRKRGVKDDDDEDTAVRSKPAKKEKQSDSSKKPKNKTSSDFSTIDFSNESKSPAGNPWNFKVSSWNINGLRAWLEKDGMAYLDHEKPDILCVQETKCSDSNLPEEMKNVEGYHTYWLSGDKDGYSGVGLLSKKEPLNIEYGIGVSEHDNEGRVITAKFEEFYLVATYVPNAGRGLVRLDYRQKWDEDFRAYLKKLDSEKPVILCGDLNVAHEEIDLANPKTNKKNAGFTKEEREGFSSLLKEGFVDSFRSLYPDATGAYTFWTYMMNARGKNVGWRLDYFVLSERFCEKLCDNVIRKDVFGSDHCPITLFLSL